MKKVNWRDEKETDGRRNERIARAHGTSFIHEHRTIKMFCEKSLTQCACLFFRRLFPHREHFFVLLLLMLLLAAYLLQQWRRQVMTASYLWLFFQRIFAISYIFCFHHRSSTFLEEKYQRKKASSHWFEWHREGMSSARRYANGAQRWVNELSRNVMIARGMAELFFASVTKSEEKKWMKMVL